MMRAVQYTCRFFLIFILVAIVVALCAESVFAATYYLNPANGNDGNSGSQGSPWKTIYKVKTTVGAGDTVNILGGTYTPSQYQGEGGVAVWDEGQSHGNAGNPITIQARPGDTVVFDGQGQAYWQAFVTSANNNGYYLVIQNLTFQNYAGIAIGTWGTNSHHLAVLNCTFQNFLNNSAAPLQTSEISHHMIFRGNRITNIGGPGNYWLQHAIYIGEGSQYIVLDNNYVEKISGYGLHFYGHNNFGLTNQNSIIRNNAVVNAHEAGMILDSTNYLNTYVYNNTFYQEQVPFPEIDGNAVQFFVGSSLSSNLNNTVIKNNVGYGYAANAAVWSNDNSRFNGALSLDYNLWNNLAAPTQIYNWSSTSYTQAGFRAALGYEGHALQANPLFVNATNRDFTLQSTSPAIDAGTFLTTTAGSASGTTLTVADAGFFTDGFGLVAGDMIQVGSNSPVQITSINYGTNAITVARSISWSNGQGVSLPYSGAQPDIGAHENATGTPKLPAPTNLRITQQ